MRKKRNHATDGTYSKEQASARAEQDLQIHNDCQQSRIYTRVYGASVQLEALNRGTMQDRFRAVPQSHLSAGQRRIELQ